MKRSVLMVLLFLAAGARSQPMDSAVARVLVLRIVSQFNAGHFTAIYALADSGFKANVREEDIVGLLNSAATLGKIQQHECVGTEEGGLTYRLHFVKRSLLMDISPVSDSLFCRFGLRPYRLAPVRDRDDCRHDNPMQSRLDSAVQQAAMAYMINRNVAGLSVGVLSDGEAHVYNFGEIRKGSGILPTENTVYEIGSITKLFTGILLAHAVMERRVGLHDDIRKYLEGTFPNLEYSGHSISLIHLSNHTSGLPFTIQLSDRTDPFDPSVHCSDSLFAEVVRSAKPDTIPGVRRSYSNLGVAILGHILEGVYGMSYEELLRMYITGPVGMSHTRVTLATEERSGMSQGYDTEGKETQYWYNRLAESAGGIRSTTLDMMKFIQTQIAGTDSASEMSHALTFGDRTDGVGLNWDISTTRKGYLRWSHDGGTDGFTALCLIYPELKSGLVLMTNNGDHQDQTFFDVATTIYHYLAETRQ